MLYSSCLVKVGAYRRKSTFGISRCPTVDTFFVHRSFGDGLQASLYDVPAPFPTMEGDGKVRLKDTVIILCMGPLFSGGCSSSPQVPCRHVPGLFPTAPENMCWSSLTMTRMGGTLSTAFWTLAGQCSSLSRSFTSWLLVIARVLLSSLRRAPSIAVKSPIFGRCADS